MWEIGVIWHRKNCGKKYENQWTEAAAALLLMKLDTKMCKGEKNGSQWVCATRKLGNVETSRYLR